MWPGFCAAALFAAAPSAVQNPITAEARRHPQAAAWVQSLTDEIGPRPSGSAADRAALTWAERALSSAGLSNIHREPVKVKHWQRGLEQAEVSGAGQSRPLAVTALGDSVATPIAGITAPLVEVESAAALSTLAPEAARGRIVFINAVMRPSQDGGMYSEVVVGRMRGAQIAAKLGAIAVIVRSVGTDSNRLPHTGGMRDAPIPAAAVSVPDAEWLHRALLAHPASVQMHLVLTPQRLPSEDSANVIGELAGNREIVLLAAHLDSWDLGTGAIDDGAGCAIVLEAAHLLHNAHGGRTIRVALMADEEQGIEGALAYAAAHQADAVALAMEADFGAERVYEVRSSGAGQAAFAKLAAALLPLGISATATPAEGGADVSPLKAAGVPVLDLLQDGITYFDFHHSANDTFDKIDPDALEQASVAFALAAQVAADPANDFRH